MRWSRLLLASAVALCSVAPLGAQAPAATVALPSLTPTLDGKEPKRPKLDAGADTNDARAYYDWGIGRRVTWDKAYPAFYWAHRLDPSDEAYRFAMYLSLYYRQSPDWRWEWAMGAEYVAKSKEAKLIDSVYTLALSREPFVHLYSEGCEIDRAVLEIPDPLDQGYYLYYAGCYNRAAEKLGEGLAKRPRNLGYRLMRARALYWTGQMAPALTEVSVALDTLRGRDAKKTSRFYQSKEMLEYMRGDIYEHMQDFFNAKKAYARALEENVAFYMAHAKLARLALEQGELPEALQEYDQALQIEGRDPTIHNDYGVALLQSDRHADAEREFRRAVELEPYFALAHYNLAVALDKQAKKDEAMAQYRSYLARAPKRHGRQVANATARLAALTQGGE